MKLNDFRVRKTWGQLKPVERIHSDSKQGRKPKWNKQDRHNWKKDVSY
jgi:hypothetical protein